MPKVSVIVPIYNVEAYLPKCLESLQQQTLQDLEIILVDDGSTDSSSQIAKAFQTEHSTTVKYFRTENKGQSHARNFGLEKAEGTYVAFVDSDDYVEKEMFQRLTEKLETYPYDVVACNAMIEYPTTTKEVQAGIPSSKTNMTLEDKKQLIQTMYPVVWNKIYKKEWLQTMPKFTEGVWYEDVLFLYEMIPHLTSIGMVEEAFYHYIQRPKSVTYTYSEKLYDVFTILDALLLYYKQENLYETYSQVLEYEYVRYVYATFIKRLAKSKDKILFKKGVEFAIQQVKDTFPHYKKNVYMRRIKPKNLYLRWFCPFVANRIYDIEKNKMN